MKGIVEGEKNYIKFERKIDSKKGERGGFVTTSGF